MKGHTSGPQSARVSPGSCLPPTLHSIHQQGQFSLPYTHTDSALFPSFPPSHLCHSPHSSSCGSLSSGLLVSALASSNSHGKPSQLFKTKIRSLYLLAQNPPAAPHHPKNKSQLPLARQALHRPAPAPSTFQHWGLSLSTEHTELLDLGSSILALSF